MSEAIKRYSAFRLLRWKRNERRRRLHVPKVFESIRVLKQANVEQKCRALVLCVVRDALPFLEPFLRHYRDKGFEHFVFLDNGSTDGTVDQLAREPGVCLLESRLPFREFNIWFRQYLVDRFGNGRWSLVVDVDEWFDWPFSQQVPFSALLEYLGRYGFTAVAGQLLDMFPEGDIRRLPPDTFPAEHRYYDLSAVRKARYPALPVELPKGVEISVCLGGLRGKIFGLKNLYLTKHPLIYGGGSFCYESQHLVCGAKLADFTAVLRHFKFSPDFPLRVERAVCEGQYFNGSSQYREYQRVMQSDSRLDLCGPQARTYKGAEQLIEEGFLVGSERFLRFCGCGFAGSGGADA